MMKSIYDFGGGEDVEIEDYRLNKDLRSITTIVDIEEVDNECLTSAGYKGFIKADLNQVQTLDKVDMIHISYCLRYIKNKNNIVQTFDNCLNEKGLLMIRDDNRTLKKIEPLLVGKFTKLLDEKVTKTDHLVTFRKNA